MRKPKLYTGGDLEDLWEFTVKLDGVRMLRDGEGKPVSRNGKPLHNLDHVPAHITDAEVYMGDWDSTITAVRSQAKHIIPLDCIYSLTEPLDPRLRKGLVDDPTEGFIRRSMKRMIDDGYEGLVLRQGNKWLKVKPEETYDVPVTGITGGSGKYEGMVGALVTPMGKVSGMTDAQRKEWVDGSIIGHTIEVKCMELTKNGKFRHPRLIRVRYDK